MGDQLQGTVVPQGDGGDATDALAMMRDLGRDSRNMAAALSARLNDLTVEPDFPASPRIRRAVAEARDLAETLRDFMSWVDEDPAELLEELKSIAADASQTPGNRSGQIRV